MSITINSLISTYSTVPQINEQLTHASNSANDPQRIISKTTNTGSGGNRHYCPHTTAVINATAQISVSAYKENTTPTYLHMAR
jgi:hypothetical protein